MRRLQYGLFLSVLLGLSLSMPVSLAATAPTLPPTNPGDKTPGGDSEKADGHKFEPFKPESVISNGSVTIGGHVIPYQAIAGTLIVHPKDWDDVPRDPNPEKGTPGAAEDGGDAKNPTAEASMFYVAYFKTGGGPRPVTFVYNGGPGSATLWLHLGAFGPRRIVTATDDHAAAAPYSLVNDAPLLCTDVQGPNSGRPGHAEVGVHASGLNKACLQSEQLTLLKRNGAAVQGPSDDPQSGT